MTKTEWVGRIQRWGDDYGIRIRKRDLDRAGLGPGDEVKIRVQRKRNHIDTTHIRFFHGGSSDVSERHDEELGKARIRVQRELSRRS